MRQCIDPLMPDLSSILDMRDLVDTQKICNSHDQAISCLKKNQFCDLQGSFAKAASPFRHRWATHTALFKGVDSCLTPNMDSFVVTEHLGDLCGSLKCPLPCITKELNAVCKLSGWVVLDVLM